jgi:hypothetical protein
VVQGARRDACELGELLYGVHFKFQVRSEKSSNRDDDKP